MANLATSRTDLYAADVITHKIRNFKFGTNFLAKYAKGGGTSVSIAFTFIFPDLHATDAYQPVYISSGTTFVLQKFDTTVSGNYTIPLAIPLGAKVVKATITFTGGSDQTLVGDFMDE